ncbi:hypothetical protein HAX54_010269, partial [Datura stramonium]|nr:hypothetical protein [Datura stramonium]
VQYRNNSEKAPKRNRVLEMFRRKEAIDMLVNQALAVRVKSSSDSEDEDTQEDSSMLALVDGP